MSKIPEKLIHEIHDVFERYESEAGYGGLYERSHEYSRPMWKKIVTRIGKAYADGELELPGEVGRRSTKGTSWDWTTWIHNLKVNRDADVLIALRGEEE